MTLLSLDFIAERGSLQNIINLQAHELIQSHIKLQDVQSQRSVQAEEQLKKFLKVLEDP